MRGLIIKILATMTSFYATAALIAGFKIDNNWQSYLVTAVVFLLFNLIITPLIKLLLLPINLLTLGLFRWLGSVLALYVFDTLYTGITVTSYYFAGYKNGLFELPQATISSFWVYCLSALCLSIVYNLVTTLVQGDST